MRDANVGTEPCSLSPASVTGIVASEESASAYVDKSSPAEHSGSSHPGPFPVELATTVKTLIQMLTSLTSSGQVPAASPDITALLQLSGSDFPSSDSSLFQLPHHPNESCSVSPSTDRVGDTDDLFSKYINQEYHRDKEKERSLDGPRLLSPPGLRPAQWSFQSLSLSEGFSRGEYCGAEAESSELLVWQALIRP